jgi:signal transduction histidine kinase
VLQTVQPMAELAEVRLELTEGASRVLGDVNLVRRVLENLVENAIRHAPSRSVVRVATSATTEGVVVRVADRGRGVPPDRRERVFQRFVQLDGGSRVDRSGRGLGLAFCKLAVEAQAGMIWVEDNEPGAAFCVRLPG